MNLQHYIQDYQLIRCICYKVKRALVLMRHHDILHHSNIDLHRPKFVKGVQRESQHTHENPYKYDESHSVPYYFCPKDEDTKLLFGKTHSEEHESPYFCESPLKSRFLHCKYVVHMLIRMICIKFTVHLQIVHNPAFYHVRFSVAV